MSNQLINRRYQNQMKNELVFGDNKVSVETGNFERT